MNSFAGPGLSKCRKVINGTISNFSDVPASFPQNIAPMDLDLPTLLLTTVYITGLMGGLLLFSWAQTRSSTSLAMAGLTFLLIALGMGLLSVRGDMSNALSVSLAGSIFALAHGLLYSSVRMFNGRPPIFLSATVGAIAWLVASEFDLFSTSIEARAVVISVIIAGYSFLLSIEFARGGPEQLPSARAACILSAAHGFFFLLRAALILGWTSNATATAFAQSWSSILTFEALTAAVVLSFLLMSMSRERAEAGYRRAALYDYLTGIYNRRAFIEEAERTIRREAQRERSLSLLIFDLDRFKQINDEHGHPVGDQVLRSFCSLVSQFLPAGSLFGRIGGEEFAALVTDAEIDQAQRLGEEIRKAFADVVVVAGGNDVRATTSIGVASSPRGHVGLSELLSGADAALYVAKSRGRNCVQAHGLDERIVAAGKQRNSRSEIRRARA